MGTNMPFICNFSGVGGKSLTNMGLHAYAKSIYIGRPSIVLVRFAGSGDIWSVFDYQPIKLIVIGCRH